MIKALKIELSTSFLPQSKQAKIKQPVTTGTYSDFELWNYKKRNVKIHQAFLVTLSQHWWRHQQKRGVFEIIHRRRSIALQNCWLAKLFILNVTVMQPPNTETQVGNNNDNITDAAAAIGPPGTQHMESQK